MVYEMQNKMFAIDLDNVHSVLEVGQVCNLNVYVMILRKHIVIDDSHVGGVVITSLIS